MSVTVQITPAIAEGFLQRVPLEQALKGFPNYADVLRAAWERIPAEKRAG